MFETYILKIDKNIEKDDFDRLLSSVSKEKKEKISRIHRFEDAQRTLLGDVLVRYAVCKKLGIRNTDLFFKTNEYGKPLLLKPSGIHFNISHSGNWVVCAVDNHAVGIDIEMIKPIDFKIAERFFSKDEYLSIINQPEKTKLKFFYMIWTLKESYIKAEGKGLSIPLNSFTIRMVDNDINVSLGNEIRKLHFCQSFIESDAVYAICTQNSETLRSYFWNIKTCLKELQNIVLQL